jgi:tetratricopeptide (TPR) repeat protein
VEQSPIMLAPLALALPLVVAQAATPLPAGPAPQAQADTRTPVPNRSEAYYQFLLARHLEGQGEIDTAIAAFRRAVDLDPASAEIRAELAGLFVRQNRADEAIAAANEALKLDAANGEANWVLGTVYAALVQSAQETGAAGSPPADLDRAIGHLEKAQPARGYDLGLLLTLGRLYLAKQDYAKAVDVLSIVRRQTAMGEASYLLAQAMDGSGRRQEAIDVLRDAVTDEPRFFRAWLLMADLLERDQRYREAAGAYEQAARQNPRATELRVRQGSALLAAEAPAAARDVLEAYVKSAPTDAAGLSLLSEAQRQSGDLDAAEATARRLLALEPRGLRAPYALALVFEQRREYAKVIETLEPVVVGVAEQPSQSPRMMLGALARLGYAYQETGQYDRAIATFERLQAVAPADGLGDLYLAQVHIAARRYDRAVEIARRGRTARPADSRFARLEAQALRQSGRFAEAIAVLRAQIATVPDEASYLALATVHGEATQWDAAMNVLDEAQQAYPEDADIPFQRGALLEQQKNYAEAERAFRGVIDRDPRHAPALNYLGYMLAERGERLDEAVRFIERALEVDPHNGSYLDSLGWAWFRKGDAAKARPYLEKAAAQLPRNSVVQDHWGDVLYALKQRDAAMAAWQKAIAGDGEQVDLEAIKRKLTEAQRGK